MCRRPVRRTLADVWADAPSGDSGSGLLGKEPDQVGEGHDPGGATVLQHDRTSKPRSGEELRQLAQGGVRLHAEDVGGHDASDRLLEELTAPP